MSGWSPSATQCPSYLTPATGVSWDPHRMEYAFAAQATLDGGDVVLRADEYATGTVDWHSFDAAGAPSPGTGGTAVGSSEIRECVLAAPVRYPGMPADRLWEFEDARVWLGGVDAGPTDLARLALVEFSLVYGNDWFVVPVDLPYGSVARIDHLTVWDTFGERIDIGPARQAARPGWTMFHLPGVAEGGPLADVFVLPATVRHPLESPPIEEVAFFRDEMANLVWAVERIVPGPSGEPVQRARAAGRTSARATPGCRRPRRCADRLPPHDPGAGQLAPAGGGPGGRAARRLVAHGTRTAADGALRQRRAHPPAGRGGAVRA